MDRTGRGLAVQIMLQYIQTRQQDLLCVRIRLNKSVVLFVGHLLSVFPLSIILLKDVWLNYENSILPNFNISMHIV